MQGKTGKCRKCRESYDIYRVWNGRSHLCPGCRAASRRRKNMDIRAASWGLAKGEVNDENEQQEVPRQEVHN